MPYAIHISGIYLITCKVNDKHYVGKSVHCMHRLGQHKIQLKENRHHSFHLQRAYNKHGVENFTFSILEEYPVEFLDSMENYWINLLDSTNRSHGYNIASPNGVGGFVTVEETRLKLKHSRLGTNLSDVTKEKLRKINLGNKLSTDQFNNLMEAGIAYRTTAKYKQDLLNRKLKMSRPMILYNIVNQTWKLFDSIRDATKSINASEGAVHACIDVLSRSVKGHLVFSKEQFDPTIIYKKQKRKNGRKKYKTTLGEL